MSGIIERNGTDVIERGGVSSVLHSEAQLKVAVTGIWPKTIGDTPCNDPSWSIWTCSNASQRLSRVDRHFELHDIPTHEKKWKEDGIWAMLQGCPKLVLAAAHPAFPEAEIYPKEAILKKFGSRYFTSSVAWMIALAIHEGADEIGIFGVNMETNDEYEFQRPCCEYLLGVAIGLGINVTIPDGCDLLKSPHLYGYETNNTKAWESLDRREKELKAKLAEVQSRLETAKQDLNLIRGALLENQQLRKYI